MEKRIKRIHICDSIKFVSLGRTGENEFRTVEIDVSNWVSGDVTYRIIYSRPDGITYPVAITRNGDILSWELKAYDVEVAGFGHFEVRTYIGDTIGKSATFKIEVAQSIQTDETTPGIARPDWVNDIIDKVVISDMEQTEVSTESGGLNLFTVTLTNGESSTFEVRNGEKGDTGDKGDKGVSGYTPKRGTDYWTQEDKTAIIEDLANEGYVKNTDYANNETGGVIKTLKAYGTETSSSGSIRIVKATEDEIKERSNLYHPIVPANLEYAVKSISDEYYATIQNLNTLFAFLNNHAAEPNPHGIDADMVGAYSKETTDAAFETVNAEIAKIQADIGNISAALDSIIALQNSLIGGEN